MVRLSSTPVTVPVLETARLRMRGHVVEDFLACAAMWGDPRVTRHISGRPSTPEEVWSRLLRYAGHWSLLGFGYWLVEEKATGSFVGEVGFADFKRDLRPSIQDSPELGWVLSVPMQGKGYATEAVRAAVAWGDAHFGLARTVCLIGPENEPSLRVAAKCGYRELLRTTYREEPTVLFSRSEGGLLPPQR